VRTNMYPLTPVNQPIISKLKLFQNVVINVSIVSPLGAASFATDLLTST